jgi:glycosyltransferase involved in cell wall biosynthesis
MTRVAYIVSRFPLITETFVLRELDELAKRPEFEVSLNSLFSGDASVLHARAERWLPRLHRAEASGARAALGRFLRSSPNELVKSAVAVLHDYWRSPRVLVRALIAWFLALDLAQRISDGGADHVHAHFATYPALAAWTVHRLTGIPFSFTAHAHDIFVHDYGLERRCNDAAFVVAISNYNRDFLIRKGAPERQVHVVRCGIPTAAYRFLPRIPQPGRAVTGVCVASFSPYKGHDVLIRALAQPDAPNHLRLRLVGDGPRRSALERLAAEIGVADKVDFLGRLTEHEVAEELGRADFLVLPSVVAENGDTEGLPIALMEALAAGLPTVASDLTGIPELIRDGETGLLVEPGDAAGLAEGLSRIARDADDWERRLRQGRELVEAQHELRRCVDQLGELIRSRHPAPRASQAEASVGAARAGQSRR